MQHLYFQLLSRMSTNTSLSMLNLQGTTGKTKICNWLQLTKDLTGKLLLDNFVVDLSIKIGWKCNIPNYYWLKINKSINLWQLSFLDTGRNQDSDITFNTFSDSASPTFLCWIKGGHFVVFWKNCFVELLITTRR